MPRNRWIIFIPCLFSLSLALIVLGAEPEIKQASPVLSIR